MGNTEFRERSIPATDDNGRQCTLTESVEYRIHRSSDQTVKAPVRTRVFVDGEELRIEGKGKYRSALTGRGFVSDHPDAP
jgi:hypothetical protein